MGAHTGFMSVSLVVAALAVSAGAALGASPTASWHMNETSGSVAKDGTGNGYDGALKNIKRGVPGATGTGFEFNGTSSRILVKDAPGLRAGDKDLVVTSFVAFTKVPAEDYDLIRKGLSSSSGGDWKMEIIRTSVGAQAYCYWKGSMASKSKTGGPDLADGRYHKITCEKHATTVALVVDGKRYSSTKTIGRIDTTAQLSIGAKAGSGGDWYKGRMDEVSVTIG
jgi:concanavalin A-like lectin/glucanase superfamily protein